MERGTEGGRIFLAHLSACPPYPPPRRSIGGSRVLLVGVALWSLGTLVAPPAAKMGLIALCTTRLFVGLGEGLAPSSATNIMARIIPE